MSQDHTQDDESSTVEIPEHIADTIQTRIEDTRFDSNDEYVSFALEQLLAHIDRQEADVSMASLDETDTDAVEDRLESLGYL